MGLVRTHPRRRGRRSFQTKRGGFYPTQLAGLKFWLRNTVSSGPITSVADLLASNPATQVDTDRTPDGAAGNGVAFDGSDVLTWPITAANLGSATKFWLGCWIKPINSAGVVQIFFSTYFGAASFYRVECSFSPTGKVTLGYTAADVSQKFGNSTSNGSVSTGVPAFIIWAYDSTGATDADKVHIYVDGVDIPLTFSGTATLGALNAVTGNHIIGGRGDSDTPTAPMLSGNVCGQDIFGGDIAPTAAERAALRAFNPLV